MTAPSKLYKYEPWSIQAIENLKRQVIYFGSPLLFNDPYDCALQPNVEPLSDDEVEEVRKRYCQERDLPESARREFETLPVESLKALLGRAARAAFQEAIGHFLSTRGVACFSERNDDLLMWSHYGGKYRGFCLEFSTHLPPFSKIRQVRYVNQLPAINVATILPGNVPDTLLDDLFCTKSSSWSYEREWRAIHSSAGTAFCYTAETLTGVYFGPDIDSQALEIVCLILRGQNPHVKFWKGSRSTSEFRVDFTEFHYTSHLEAKERGLIP